MSSLARLLNDAANAADLQFALDVGVKATALLLAAAAAGALLRRSSAALRHRVWCLTFAALVLLPGLSAALPKWRLPILPRAEEDEAASEAAVAAAPSPVEFAAVAAPLAPPIEPAFFDVRPAQGEPPPEAFAAAPSPPSAIDLAESETPTIASAAAWQLPGLATIWLAGAALALAPLAIGLARMFVLRRQSRAVDCAVWTSLVDEVRARLGLARRVALLETRRAVMPMTWGLVRPAVLLPSQASEWTERLRRIVLLHELAHVKRYDVGFQLLGRLTCALYWFHPLAWYALRRLRIDRELACDDCVVHSGELASDYAAELLQIARSYQPVRLAAAIAMAQRSSLEHRIRAMFDRACSHLPLSGRAARLLLVGVTILVTAIAAVRLTPRAAAEDDQSEPPIAESSEATPSSDASSEPADEDAEEVEFAGVVTDADGKPLAGAEIWMTAPEGDDRDLASRPSVRRLAESDRQGQFSFRLGPLRREEPSDANWTSSADLIAKAPGHGCDWLPLAAFEKNPATSPQRDEMQQRIDQVLGRGRFASRALKLPPDAGPVRGRLIDLEGRPLADVSVSIETIQAPDLAILDQAFESSSRDLYYRAVNTSRIPSQIDRQAWQTLMPSVKTNENGEFSLSGLGAGQMVTVTLAGERVAAERLYIVGRDMETKHIPYIEPNGAKDVFLGVRFTHAAGPGRSVGGRITEFQSGKPIAGARVFIERLFGRDDALDSAGRLRLDTRHIQDVTDEQGGFRLIGTPPGDGHVLNVVPPKSNPWLMAEQEFAVDSAAPTLDAMVNVQICRGIWIEGRVTDAATGEAVPSYVDYLALQKNPQTPEKLGLHEAWDLHRFPTDSSGRYRVAGLPGPGVLLVRARGETVYPLSVGAEQVDGYDAKHDYLPTTPTFAPLSNWNLVRQIDPPADAKTYSLDLTLSAGVTLTGRVAWPAGESPSRVEGLGLVEKDSFFGPLAGDRFAVNNYEPDVARDLFFRSADNSRVAHLHLEGKPPENMTVTLEPAVTVKGRLIDAETEAEAVGYGLFCESTKFGKFRIDDVLTDKQGRFEIKGLLAGNVYQMDAYNPQRFVSGKNGFIIDLSGAKPGDVIELGDVTGPAAKAKLQTGKNDPQPDRAAQGLMAAKNPKDKSPPRASDIKILRGRVTFGGRPAGGAHVTVVAQRTSVQRGGDFKPSGEVLAEAVADDKGEYALSLTNVSSKTHAYANVIARKEGAAIAWRPLNLEAVGIEASLELAAEAPIRAKLIDLEGRPAAGVRLVISAVLEHKESGMPNDGVGDHTSEFATAAWPPAVTSDKQGRFVIHGIHAGRGVMLNVEANDRLAPQDIALNAGWPEQRGELDATYRPLVKNTKPGEEAVLALAPAQPFEGVVRYADSGKPAPHARVTIGASQQEFGGSMILVAGSADELGRYRIVPKPGVRFGLTVYPPAGVPYLARQTPFSEPIRWKASEQVKQVDFSLPRGVLVQGKVVEAHGETPVVGAAIQYIPESKNNSNDSEDIITRWQAIKLSDDQGRFAIAVLPGPGRLLAHGPQGKYVLQEVGSREIYEGRPGGQRSYAHAVAKIDAQPGQDVPEVKFELQPGATATGRIVDEQGNPIEEATVISRLSISPYSLYWRGRTTPTLGGQFELTGLANDAEYPVYFLDPKRRLGATEIVKAGDTERTVTLKPCGQARLRLVNKAGAPVAGQNAMVEMVVTPGTSRYDPDANQKGELGADADFISNIDPINHRKQPASDEQGYLVGLHSLIPGASYRVIAMRGGRLQAVKEFQASANETLELGDVVVEPSE